MRFTADCLKISLWSILSIRGGSFATNQGWGAKAGSRWGAANISRAYIWRMSQPNIQLSNCPAIAWGKRASRNSIVKSGNTTRAIYRFVVYYGLGGAGIDGGMYRNNPWRRAGRAQGRGQKWFRLRKEGPSKYDQHRIFAYPAQTAPSSPSPLQNRSDRRIPWRWCRLFSVRIHCTSSAVCSYYKMIIFTIGVARNFGCIGVGICLWVVIII